jgi:hypothetical protein
VRTVKYAVTIDLGGRTFFDFRNRFFMIAITVIDPRGRMNDDLRQLYLKIVRYLHFLAAQKAQDSRFHVSRKAEVCFAIF